MQSDKTPLVIYIEDDEDDQELCRIALEEIAMEVDLRFIGDGQSALDYFQTIADSSPEGWPRLILLDLSMPAIDGWDVIDRFRSNTTLSSIPLVVFTTSNSPSDRKRAYEKGVNAYMVKPAGLGELTECFNLTLNYWLRIVASNH